ncbi:MAG: DUF4124 domain-containing protein [Pseudomonadota bacterium]
MTSWENVTHFSAGAQVFGRLAQVRIFTFILAMFAATLLAAPVLAATDSGRALYRWVDDEGVVHFGDSIPAQYAEQEKQILNNQGVAIGRIAGKATEEELAQQAAEAEAKAARERGLRADRALLATYLSIGEIERHRDRRVELLEAQSRVSELYLTNLRKRLVSLLDEASNYKPYTVDPEAPMIRPALADDIKETKDSIVTYETRLAQHKTNAQQLRDEFSVAIDRYAKLTQAKN